MEVLMAVAITGIVALLTPQIITHTVKIYVLSRAKLELQREARSAMYLVTREIRQAQSGSILIDQMVGQPYYSRIRFSLIQGTSITIAQSGTSLILTRGNTSTTLSKNLVFLSFTFPRSDDLTIISVAMTLQEQIYNGMYKALHMASERVRVMN